MEDYNICSQVSWLDSFLEQKLFYNTSGNEQVRLWSGDGFSVCLPAYLLLATSKLARMTFFTRGEDQDVFLPSVQGSTLLLLAEILRSGRTSYLGNTDRMGHRLKELNQVMGLLDISGCASLMMVKNRSSEIHYEDSVQMTTLNGEQSSNPPHTLVSIVTKIKDVSNIVNSDQISLSVDQDENVFKVEEINKEGSDAAAGVSERSDQQIQRIKKSAIVCQVCEKMYTKKLSWKKHMYTMHRESMIPCGYCEKKFILRKSLEEHVARAHVGPRIGCDHCEGFYGNKASLYVHMVRYHRSEMIPCNDCDMRFFHEKTLNMHTRSKHGQVEQGTVKSGIKEVCSHCSSTFSTMHNLRRHIKRNHKFTSDDVVDSGDLLEQENNSNKEMLNVNSMVE